MSELAPSPEMRSQSIASRNALMRLPWDLKEELRRIPRPVHLLHALVEEIDQDDYVRRAEAGEPEFLARVSYPLERAVCVLDRHVCALAEIAVREAGLPPGNDEENLVWLAALGLTTRRRSRSLLAVHLARGALERPMSSQDHRELVRAAAVLDREIVRFLADYTAWFLEHAPGLVRGATAR